MKKKIAELKPAWYLFLGLSATWLFIQACQFLPGWWRQLWSVMTPVIIGIGVAYVLLSPVRALERFFAKRLRNASHKVHTGLSVGLIFGIIAVLLVLMVAVWIPAIVKNSMELSDQWPAYIAKTNEWLEAQKRDNALFANPVVADFIDAQIEMLAENALGWLTDLGVALWKIFLPTVILLGKILIGLIAAIYCLLERHSLKEMVGALMRNYLGDAKNKRVTSYLREVDIVFGRFLTARIIESFFVFLIAWVGFLALGIPYAALLAVITGVLNLIPYFGAFIAYFIALAVALLTVPQTWLLLTIFSVALQALDGWLIAPMLYGERLKMSGFMVIVALTLFGGFFGLWGMTVGVPCFALLLVAVQRVGAGLAQKRGEKTETASGEGEGVNT